MALPRSVRSARTIPCSSLDHRPSYLILRSTIPEKMQIRLMQLSFFGNLQVGARQEHTGGFGLPNPRFGDVSMQQGWPRRQERNLCKR